MDTPRSAALCPRLLPHPGQASRHHTGDGLGLGAFIHTGETGRALFH